MTPVEEGDVRIIVLGNMQDGGLPHAGCLCSRCSQSYLKPTQPQYVACLGIVDFRSQPVGVWLIDATPDIKYQLYLLAEELGPHPIKANRLRQPNGIFLTHAHMGHTSGLIQLGPESMNVNSLPIYAFHELLQVIGETRLWELLLQCLQPIAIKSHERIMLAQDLNVTPIPVPHRDELGSGTAAYRIEGPEKTLLYVPDIDSWKQWKQADDELADVDFLLADGTFFSLEETNGRSDIPHPLITETLKLFAGRPFQLVLTHFNHTNPVLDTDSEARALTTAHDVLIAQTGQRFYL